MVAITRVLGLEAAMEVMEKLVTLLLTIHLLLPLVCTCLVRAVHQCLEIVLTPGGELSNISQVMGWVLVRQREILLLCPLVPVPHNSLLQGLIHKFQLDLQDTTDPLLQQEALLMDHPWGRQLLVVSSVEEKTGDMLEALIKK